MTLLRRVHLWWHTATVLHLRTCWYLFTHNVCHRQSRLHANRRMCVPRHRFVCAHSGCVLVSFTTSPINTQITFDFLNAIRMFKRKKKNQIQIGLQPDNFFIGNHFWKYVLWLSDLMQIFTELLSVKTSCLSFIAALEMHNSNPALLPADLLHSKISTHIDWIAHNRRAGSSFLLKSNTHKNRAISSTCPRAHNRATLRTGPVNSNTANLCSSLFFFIMGNILSYCTRWLHYELWWVLMDFVCVCMFERTCMTCFCWRSVCARACVCVPSLGPCEVTPISNISLSL